MLCVVDVLKVACACIYVSPQATLAQHSSYSVLKGIWHWAFAILFQGGRHVCCRVQQLWNIWCSNTWIPMYQRVSQMRYSRCNKVDMSEQLIWSSIPKWISFVHWQLYIIYRFMLFELIWDPLIDWTLLMLHDSGPDLCAFCWLSHFDVCCSGYDMCPSSKFVFKLLIDASNHQLIWWMLMKASSRLIPKWTSNCKHQFCSVAFVSISFVSHSNSATKGVWDPAVTLILRHCRCTPFFASNCYFTMEPLLQQLRPLNQWLWRAESILWTRCADTDSCAYYSRLCQLWSEISCPLPRSCKRHLPAWMVAPRLLRLHFQLVCIMLSMPRIHTCSVCQEYTPRIHTKNTHYTQSALGQYFAICSLFCKHSQA